MWFWTSKTQRWEERREEGGGGDAEEKRVESENGQVKTV